MMLRTLLASSAAALLLGASSHIAPASEDEPYSIWWSPELELESLDQIDERLSRPFLPNGEGLYMFRQDGNQALERHAPNCTALKELSEQGYRGAGSTGRYAQAYHTAECEALRYLKEARPAEKSYLAGFIFNRESFQLLPDMVSFGPSCESACREYYANEARHPMGEPTSLKQLELISNHEMTFKTELELVEMEILARADLNFDGFDDILLRSSVHMLEGSWSSAILFLLTRDAPDSVLWVVNPKQYLCPDYRC